MNNKYLSAFMLSSLALFSPIAAEPPQTEGQLSSTNAEYDGSALKLKGNVVLDHGLGKMTAEEASLQRQEAGKDFPFSLIHLKKEVLLSLRDSGKMSCDEAELDFASLKGNLTAPLKGLVTFSEQIQKKGKEKEPISLASPHIELTFNKIDTAAKAEYEVKTVLAKEGVSVEYNKEFILQAEKALYRMEGDEMKGIISAYPKDSSSKCLLTHGSDVIEASAIDLDTLKSTLSFQAAKGHIASSFIAAKEKSALSFESEFMTWDDLHQTLSLKGKSEVVESSLGVVKSEGELTIEQAVVGGKKQISSVQTKGPAALIYKDSKSGMSHKISSCGIMKIDRDSLSAKLVSPAKYTSKIPLADQVYYEEMKMGVHADSAIIEFSEEGEKLEPISFSLKGNVSLISRDTSEPMRCAVADRMTYSPDTKTLILSANPGQKVLFWDEQQAVRMSAQEVHLTQSGALQQTVIQGVGNVKFSLSTEENEALKKIFPQYKPQM